MADADAQPIATKEEAEDEDSLPKEPVEIVKFLHTQVDGAWRNFVDMAESADKEKVDAAGVQKVLQVLQSKFSTLEDAEHLCEFVNLTHHSRVEDNRQELLDAMHAGLPGKITCDSVSKEAYKTEMIHEEFKHHQWGQATKIIFDKIAARGGDPSVITPRSMLKVLEEHGDESEEADIEDLFKEVLDDQSVDFDTARFDEAALQKMLFSTLSDYISMPEVHAKMFSGLHEGTENIYDVAWDADKNKYVSPTSTPTAA